MMNQCLPPFGTEKLARLKKVLLHNPIEALPSLTQTNYSYHLFNKVPDVDQFLKEHEKYSQLLRSYGVEVLHLRDYVRENKTFLPLMPNLAYLHDIAVITRHGAILSEMCPGSRAGEEVVLKEALIRLRIPIFHEFQTHEQFEGCLILSPQTLILVDTERHDPLTIETFFPKALEIFGEVLYVKVPQTRRFMHADMIFNRVSEDLALYYPPAFLKTYLITRQKRVEIEIKNFFTKRNIELIALSDEEQKNWGCSFVPLEPKVIFHYDLSLNAQTKRTLRQSGVEILEFHPQALLAGGGSLRCFTLRLWRDS